MRKGVLLAIFFGASISFAAPSDEERRHLVVATVGSRSILVSELEDALAQVPAFQIEGMLGKTKTAARKHYVEEVIRNSLLEEGAKGLNSDPFLRFRLAKVHSAAALRHARGEINRDVSKEEIANYYRDHLAEYVSEDRVLIWRITVKTRDEAQKILAGLKKDGSVKEFTRVAREASTDKATYLRSGNLGFVAKDGTSSDIGIAVNKGVVAAALGVRDGDIVPEPVPEGESYAIVWRRGTTHGSKRTLEEVSSEIRAALVHHREEEAESKFLLSLRKERVSGIDHAGLLLVEVDSGLPSLRRNASP